MYREFLGKVQKHPKAAESASPFVNYVWEMHVLHTADYFQDCRDLFNGDFLHHKFRSAETVAADYMSIPSTVFVEGSASNDQWEIHASSKQKRMGECTFALHDGQQLHDQQHLAHKGNITSAFDGKVTRSQFAFVVSNMTPSASTGSSIPCPHEEEEACGSDSFCFWLPDLFLCLPKCEFGNGVDASSLRSPASVHSCCAHPSPLPSVRTMLAVETSA